jgi:hypothetical protein
MPLTHTFYNYQYIRVIHFSILQNEFINPKISIFVCKMGMNELKWDKK